jgi:hypothetical protein
VPPWDLARQEIRWMELAIQMEGDEAWAEGEIEKRERRSKPN